MVWVFPTVDRVLAARGIRLNALNPDSLEDAIRTAIAAHPPTFTVCATEETVADRRVQVGKEDHGSTPALEG
jgi:hypothetical protein